MRRRTWCRRRSWLRGGGAIDSFRGESSPRTWLIGILRHKMLDYLRRAGRQRPTGQVEAADPRIEGRFDERGMWSDPPDKWGGDPAALLQREEFWAAFEECLAALPQQMAQASALRTMDDVDSAEVCKVVGVTQTNLWVMLHRARARLRDCLENRWFRRNTEGGESSRRNR